MSLDLDAYSERMIAQGSRSFARAARLFSARERRSAIRLYAWCRHADDVIDGQTLGHGQRSMERGMQASLLDTLRQKTHAALAGEQVEEPPFQALQTVAQAHGLAPRYPLELLEGFAMDARAQRYDTLDELLLYCYRVAGVVGVMMAQIMGVKDVATLERAMDLGIAFQLTNIARDVMDDAQAGRLYLPRAWLRESNIPEISFAEPPFHEGLHALSRRLVKAAEPYYDSARIGLHALPYRSAWAIATALAIYRDIGSNIHRSGTHSLHRRSMTSSWLKSWRVVQGAMQAAMARTQITHHAKVARNGLWSPSEALTLRAA